jgi:hypothetical protein
VKGRKVPSRRRGREPEATANVRGPAVRDEFASQRPESPTQPRVSSQGKILGPWRGGSGPSRRNGGVNNAERGVRNQSRRETKVGCFTC